MEVTARELGIFGTGSKMLRCGLVHSSGVIYLGSYGPAPAVIWKYTPGADHLDKVAEPGEYQLDCMLEAPDGKVYIGSAYNGLIYQLDPRTDKVKSLGSPPIDSTPWIFVMTLTRKGEIYGAKGVGLFKLDWKNERIEPLGLVPGIHQTPELTSSSPIVRMLVEDKDGRLWGDSNRWLFRFHPDTRQIEPMADIVTFDPATYCLMLPVNSSPTEDLVFSILSRFSGAEVKAPFYIYRARPRKLEALPIEGLQENAPAGHSKWWQDGTNHRLLVPVWNDPDQRPGLLVVDPLAGNIADRWEIACEPGELSVMPCRGAGLYFFSGRALFRAEPEKRKLVKLADNPTPAVCRCLAMSPRRQLGADTYDLGYVFTFDVKTRHSVSHGRVWIDDHRCNYGPAAFAGRDGRYFLANHGEAEVVTRLWVTDIRSNRHWFAGANAAQLVPFADGTVWGTEGKSVCSCTANPDAVSRQRPVAPGALFRYRPGEKQTDRMEWPSAVGPLAEAPGHPGWALASQGRKLLLIQPDRSMSVQQWEMPATVMAAAHHASRTAAYWVLSDGSLWVTTANVSGNIRLALSVAKFGPVDQGFFVLPRSGRVLGVAADGAVTVYDPTSQAVTTVDHGPAPLPAGPAVDPQEDIWYYADQSIIAYSLNLHPDE